MTSLCRIGPPREHLQFSKLHLVVTGKVSSMAWNMDSQLLAVVIHDSGHQADMDNKIKLQVCTYHWAIAQSTCDWIRMSVRITYCGAFCRVDAALLNGTCWFMILDADGPHCPDYGFSLLIYG